MTSSDLANLSDEELINHTFLVNPDDPLTRELFKRFDALVNPETETDEPQED